MKRTPPHPPPMLLASSSTAVRKHAAEIKRLPQATLTRRHRTTAQQPENMLTRSRTGSCLETSNVSAITMTMTPLTIATIKTINDRADELLSAPKQWHPGIHLVVRGSGGDRITALGRLSWGRNDSNKNCAIKLYLKERQVGRTVSNAWIGMPFDT